MFLLLRSGWLLLPRVERDRPAGGTFVEGVLSLNLMKSGRNSRSLKPEKSPWLQAVERAVKAIPRGETASYARVALMAGKPGAARAVVRALHALDGIPWWRVLRSDGTVAPQVATKQLQLLRREGVEPKRKARPRPLKKPT